MVTPELIEFIRTQLLAGTNQEKIIADLTSNGWTIEDINEAMPHVVLNPNSLPEKRAKLATVTQDRQMKRSRRRKIILPILGTILAALLVYGYFTFFWTPKPDAPAPQFPVVDFNGPQPSPTPEPTVNVTAPESETILDNQTNAMTPEAQEIMNLNEDLNDIDVGDFEEWGGLDGI